MKIAIEVISKEAISPSSPTPVHLRRYQLSFLDQFNSPVFMPLLVFYSRQNCTSNVERCEKMKKSLSQALTIFYPLAGRIKGNDYIDCNDEGVYFVEAKANCCLSDILNCRDPSANNYFFPLELDDAAAAKLPTMVQLTCFECGGLAVSLGMSHKVCDALSCIMFINCWAAIARGEDEIITPQFNSAALFPLKNSSLFQPRAQSVKENIMTKRIVFNASGLATLKEKYTVDGIRPTRVEALSAFMWSRFMASTQTETDQVSKIYTIGQTVNLRSQMDPPLSNHYFGNIYVSTFTEPWRASEDGFHGIVKEIRDATRKVNSELVKKLVESTVDECLYLLRNPAVDSVNSEVVHLHFTSLCRFPMYEVDFGWGKPVWVGSARWVFKNLICFFDTESGDGIEAWINLTEEDMAKFQSDQNFVSYASLSSNV
ncbi:hypothetical protein SLA2020_073090 [Shorea laevis]